MDTGRNRRNKALVVIASIIIIAGSLGWFLGRSNNTPSNQRPDDTTRPVANNNSGAEVKSLVNYTLPDGWKEINCNSTNKAVAILPNGVKGANCDDNPNSPIKISVDPSNAKDCNQLQNVQNVSKHICSSEYINGQKSLKAETRYNQDSPYKKDTTVHAYYIDTTKGVVKLEYVYDTSNEFMMGFEQLAKSVQVKN